MYTHVYIKRSTVPSNCLHTKIQLSIGQCSTSVQNGLTSLCTIYIYIYIHQYIRAPLTVPLEHHRLLLPQAVAAHHHLPQKVVVPPLPAPPAPTTVVRSSSQQPLLLVVLWPAMAATPAHTAPGKPHPGCESICPQAHPITPPPDDSVYPQSPLRQPPEERVMAHHQGHQTGVSSLPSLAQLVTLWCPHADVSLPASILSGS
jgi:hypothetical protein